MGPLVLLEFGPIANCMGQLGSMGMVFSGAPGILFCRAQTKFKIPNPDSRSEEIL